MKEFKVLLTDNYDHATVELAAELKRNNAKVFLCSKNGAELLKCLEEINPDVIISEVFLQHIDVMGVLERINLTDPVTRPLVTVMSCIENANFERELMKKGVDYIFVKPVDCKVAVERIKQLLSWKGVTVRQPKIVNLDIEITEHLNRIGIPVNVKGYKYVREAVKIAVLNPDALNGITKMLYPTVAQRFSTTAVNTERAIRYCIDKAWEPENKANISNCFGKSVSLSFKPKNAQFIGMLADKIRMNMKDARYNSEKIS